MNFLIIKSTETALMLINLKTRCQGYLFRLSLSPFSLLTEDSVRSSFTSMLQIAQNAKKPIKLPTKTPKRNCNISFSLFVPEILLNRLINHTEHVLGIIIRFGHLFIMHLYGKIKHYIQYIVKYHPHIGFIFESVLKLVY